MRHEDVIGAVVVVVAHIQTHAGFSRSVRVDRNATFGCLVLEGAVPLVDPELVRVAVIGDKDVRPAVAVGIESHHAQTRTERPLNS